MEAKELVPYTDIERMAVAVAKSGLFANIRTPEQAATLMMLCQAEGLHPIQAVKRYDIMEDKQGRVRVSMKGEAMLAEFQSRGGKVEWIETSDQKCEAIYSAPGMVKPLRVSYTIADAKRAGLLSKTNWMTNPADMLLWRNVTRGVKRTLPAAGLGMYPSEVVQDFEGEPGKFSEKQVERILSDDLTPVLEASIAQVQAEKGGSDPPAAEASSTTTSSDGTADDEPPAFLYPDEHTPEEAQALIKAEGGKEDPNGLDSFDYDRHMKEKGLGQKCVKCEGIVRKFTSGRTGRVYLQCEKAHLLREDALAAGCDDKTAKGFTKGHSYAWI